MNSRQLNNASARLAQSLNSLQVEVSNIHSRARANVALTPQEKELLSIFSNMQQVATDLAMVSHSVEYKGNEVEVI